MSDIPIPKRIAQPGDLFVLLIPNGHDLERLQDWQLQLQEQYGGQIVSPIHITVARFSAEPGTSTPQCVTNFRASLPVMRSFSLSTDAIIHFFAPYWQTSVLRWRVLVSPEWDQFRDHLDDTLCQIECQSHFERRRHATCTALSLEQPVDLEQNPPGYKLPAPLFVVQEIVISHLKTAGEFEILDRFALKD